MPKIAELREIDGEVWVRIDVPPSSGEPISIMSQSEIDAIKRDEREGNIEVIRWFANVKKFTADDIIKRIRAVA